MRISDWSSDVCSSDLEAFVVGSREFDPVKVGVRSEGYAGFQFHTDIRGNHNTGHEYVACGLSDTDRMALIEFLKTLSREVAGHRAAVRPDEESDRMNTQSRSEEHTSELQSLMRISYAVFSLKKKTNP